MYSPRGVSSIVPNRFQHDTNPSLDTENVTDGELRGYVKLTLKFVVRKFDSLHVALKR